MIEKTHVLRKCRSEPRIAASGSDSIGVMLDCRRVSGREKIPVDIRLITRRALALALLAIPAVAADDNEKDKGKDKDKNYAYLALGDSIPFGLDLTKLPP